MNDETWIIEVSYRGSMRTESDWSPWDRIGETGYRINSWSDAGMGDGMKPRTMVACVNKVADFIPRIAVDFTMIRIRDLVTGEIIPGEIF